MPAEGSLRNGDGAGFELIETLRFEPDTGFVRADAHLARLAASASMLGFRCDPAAVRGAMQQAVAAGGGTQRLRVSLARDGRVACAAVPFTPLPADTCWRIAVARTRLDSRDPLLAHKTTRRALYDAARREFPVAEVDEVLLLNERDEICEGTITNLFLRPEVGSLVTPDRSSGLLPGILRANLIAEGQATTAIVTVGELTCAPALCVGNSLRGLIEARLVA